MNHPSFDRALKLAQAFGSTASSVKGVRKYLQHSLNRQQRQLIVCGPIVRKTNGDWQEQVRRRKADPEAKRARDDKRFRKAYLARLRKHEAAQLICDMKTAAGVSEFVDNVGKRVEALKDIARRRSIIYGKPVKWKSPPEFDRSRVRAVPIRPETARRLGVRLILRGKDAGIYPCVQKSHFVHEDPVTRWKNSKPRTESRAVNDNFVRSFGLIIDSQRLECLFHETTVTIELPTDYNWDIDGNGIRAVDSSSTRDDYHPTSEELLRSDAAEYIVGKINANREMRREMAARAAVEAAAVQGVYVCLADSLRAGNCRAGTLEFGRRHGLDERRHYSAPELLTMANGDASRVRLAVTAARLRHEREEKAGVCLLADHRA